MPGQPVPAGPLRLAAGASCVVDERGVRFTAYGPATVAFVREAPRAMLVHDGLFSLERMASAPRGTVATVASAAGWLRATGPVRLAGRAQGAALWVEVVTGSVEAGAPGAPPLSARARVRLGPGGQQPLTPAGGTLEQVVEGLGSAELAAPGDPLSQGDLRAALARDLRAFEQAQATPVRGEGEDSLAYRRRLAAAAAARMRARTRLSASLLRHLAAGLGDASGVEGGLGPRARSALRGGR